MPHVNVDYSYTIPGHLQEVKDDTTVLAMSDEYTEEDVKREMTDWVRSMYPRGDRLFLRINALGRKEDLIRRE